MSTIPTSLTALLSIDRAASSHSARSLGRMLAASMLLAAFGCDSGQVLMDGDTYDSRPGGSDGGPGGEYDDGDHPPGPLNPDTVSVEQVDCFDYADVLTEDRELINLHFTCDASTAGLTPGQIVWGVDDGGYLRRIVSVENVGTEARLVTEFASLAEAVTDVDFDETIDLDDSARGKAVNFDGRVLDEVAVDGGNSTVTVTRGQLDVSSQIHAKGSFGFLRLKSVTSRNTFNVHVQMDVDYHSDGPVDRAQTVELDTFSEPFSLRVGPVTVRGTLKSKVSLGFEHTATGPIDVSTSFSGGGNIQMGGTYYMPSNWQPYWNPNLQGQVIELEPDGMENWDGRVYLKIEASVHLNGNPGGTSWYEFDSDGHSQGSCETMGWQTSGTIAAQTAMRLRFMGRSVNHDFPAIDDVVDTKEGTLWHESPPAGCPGATGSGLCAAAADITCGGVVYGDTSSDPFAQSEMDAYPCAVGNYDAPELVYRWVAQATAGPVEFRMLGAEPTVLNHDIFVLGGGSGCAADSCVAFGFNSVEWDPVPGQTYFLAIDGFDDNAGAFEAQLDCGGF
ncbi:MAG: hypothetical protein KDA24_06340 [Deltaproteobacteria bacterium]|nr:hypothetical protein [Deltaproteobacteria bacterium]